MKTKLTLIAFFLSLATLTRAQQDFSKVEIKATHVAGNVYMLTGSGGNIGVSVLFNGATSNTLAVPVATAAPGLFLQTDGAAIVQNAADDSLNTPSNPAAKGSTIVAYLTGSGPVNPAQKNGVPASLSLIYATAPVTATIGSATATVSFTGLTPTFIGLVQMNIVVPTTLAAGVYPLAITIDGQAANTATIAVK